ncbi:MAG: hypothetical protein ABR538_12145, partial [Candidatus Binatia bacterium]
MTRHLNVASLLSSFLVASALVAAAAPAALAQSKDQEKCINAMNKAGAKVAASQGKENSGCVKAAGASKLVNPTTDDCVAADGKGKVGGAQTKTTDTQVSKCTNPFPAFGYTSAATINAAAEAEEVALLGAVFGSPVDGAMFIGGDGAKCQASVTKSFEKLAATRMKAFLGCKKLGLKEDTINNAGQLQNCMGSDPKLKVAGAKTKLTDTVTKACDGVTLASAFPGDCTGQAGSPAALGACVAREVECHMCLFTNAMDGLNIGCDIYDDGLLNQTCRQCGNSATEGAEACDDGGDSATCDVDCTLATCGDGYANAAAGEACDTSGESAGCDDDCSLPVCGDGNLNETSGEVCDDGNLVDGDGCDTNCTVTACGNGITTAGEECDDANPTEGDGCDTNCTVTACGNGIVTTGETCDDDNLVDGDGCDSNCTPTGCGNGVVTGGEACDEGGETATCDDDCTAPACHDGNHNAAAGEQCDDGNLVDTDSCVGSCVVATCGDGFLCNGGGCTTGPSGGIELCDNAGANSNVTPDACRTNCRPASCGDNVTDTGETCDTGGNSMTCDSNCTAAACGDGFINPAANETCDDSGESASCDANCTAATCGDGTLNVTAGEICDDGNVVSGDYCSSTCQNGPGSGENDPQCPDLGELVLYSKMSNVPCSDNNDCTAPRTCDTSIGSCTTVADLDSGWKGLAQDSDINDAVTTRARLLCEGPDGPTCGECEVAGIDPGPGNCRCANNVRTICDEPFVADTDDCGGAVCNCFFGAPFPLNSAGTHVCVVNRFSEDLTGTANVDLGAGEITAKLRAQVFLGDLDRQPCPVCGGTCSITTSTECGNDAGCPMGETCELDTPGDGIRDGVCIAGTHDGLSCDAIAYNPSFPAVYSTPAPGSGGGLYSIDCQPDVGKNVSGQGLKIQLDQTTGLSSITAALDCDGA